MNNFQKSNKNNNEVEDLKVAPHSLEAEQSVIGGLLLDNSRWDSIAGKVSESDLIGEWTFIELQDENGEKQTKIPLTRFGNDMGFEKVSHIDGGFGSIKQSKFKIIFYR